MTGSSSPLDDDLTVPSWATLISDRITAVLKTVSGSAQVPISTESLRESSTRRFLLVGRQAATADLRIQHGSISRKHAILYYDGDHLVLLDLGGKHGTTVNEQRIHSQQPIQLRDGDRVLFGNVRESVFRVEIRDKTLSTQQSVASGDVNETTTAGSEDASVVETQVHQSDHDLLERAGEGLSGRAKRQAEIAAMMSSLDDAPMYTVHKAPTDQCDVPNSQEASNDESDRLIKMAKKHRLPVTRTFRIDSESDRRNAVTTLAVDPAGSRFAVGSTDASLRLYDFGGMDQGRHESFRSVVPDEGHWPVACAYSNTGDRILVGTGSVQPVVLDRDGHEVIKFVRGDMYVNDQAKTVGHTAAVSAVDWHPLERDWVLTASADGSARIWNLNGQTQFQMLVCDKVYSAKNARGQRTAVTAVCFHPGGREFALGTVCGSVQIWNRSRASGRPDRTIFAAHGEGQPITSLCYNVDGTKLASRSTGDDTVRVWNAQRLSRSSTPKVTCREALSSHEHANVAFSPDGKILCVGVAQIRELNGKRQEMGRLHFYNADVDEDTAMPILSLDTDAHCSPIIVKWHARLNQIFMGCSDGRILVLYDPKLSSKGALMADSKVGRSVDDLSELLKSRAPTGSAGISGEIVTPFSLPMYRQDVSVSTKKRKRDERKDPLKSQEPERPATGKHKGVGANLSFAQFVADQTASKTKAIAGKDPREALFQYNEGESFVDRAYEGNTGKLLAEKTAEEEEEEFRSRNKK